MSEPAEKYACEYEVGDYFRWSWRNPPEHEPYWCCSQIARFDGKRLKDTYWSTGGGKSWTPEQAEKELILRFIANEQDLKPYDDPYPYYARSDIVNLYHPNSFARNLYIRKGAKRDRDVMLQALEKARDEWAHESQYAAKRAGEAQTSIEEIIDGCELDDVHIFSGPR